jgi:UDP-N-acetylmuramate--alanine ligase
MSRNRKKILMVGGGTGGHLYPLISVAKELIRKGDCELFFIGSGTPIEKDIFEFENIKWKKISSGKFRRNISIDSLFRNIADIFLIIVGFFQAFIFLKKYKPDLIFSKGGYVSVPVSYAARFLAIPLLLHESDAMPSLTTKLCSSWAKAVFTAFPIGIFPLWLRKKAIYTGLPIREDFKKIKKLDEEYILIVGGSSGALKLNNIVFEALPELLKHHEVVHLTGPNETRTKDIKNSLDKRLQSKYKFFEYRADMYNLIRDAKLVISRAGATSIFEIAALNKKAIFVPIGEDVAPHQKVNADLIENLNLADVFLESGKPKEFLEKIDFALKKRKVSCLSSLYFPDSENYIASLIEDYLDFLSLEKVKKIFMIGIGGVSMKALAQILIKMGKVVKGSDLKTGGHFSHNINLSYDLVAHSSAASSHSPARVEHNMAKKLKIKVVKRSQLIGQIMKGYRGISVSGMHGKTTTSSIIAKILTYGGLDPSYLIGAEYKEDSPSYAVGSGIDFVNEACEYDGSFLDFPAKIAVVTSIEREHLDYFRGGLPEILKTFKNFILNIYPGGLLVYCQDDPNVRKLVESVRKELIFKKIKLISYGFSPGSNAKISAYKVDNGVCSFKIDQTEFTTRKVGKFFALDCAAGFAVAKFLGISDEQIVAGINNYSGASRRFEFLGQKSGVMVYDDYGHHPTEIDVTLQAFHEAYPDKRKIVIFQPHQQKRFNDFYRDFLRVFSDAKVGAIGILPVFQVAGRDEPESETSQDLIKDLGNEKKYFYLTDYENAIEFVKTNLKSGDVLLTMGATDVYKIAEKFIND